ncbi:MAG: HTTM domain-containing protein [Kiritimatiellae bacterium]|nr:HTTM domain-containing protein [Kiritimatiellia bacterium]
MHSGGLGITRILFTFVLILEVCQTFYYRDLIYTRNPFEQLWHIFFHRDIVYTPDPFATASFMVSAGLVLWIACLVLLCLGYCTRLMAVLSFVATSLFLVPYQAFEYHMDYIYQGVGLLLIFCPTHRSLSIDRYLSGCRPEVSRGWYHLLVFVGIALVYTDSIFHKLASPMWIHGLGLWQPGSLIHFTWAPSGLSQPLLNVQWLALALGYLTLLFESLFIILMWFRRLWFPLTLVGVGLHLGIVAAFPIPWFGLGVTGLFVLMIPIKYSQHVAEKAERVLFAFYAKVRFIEKLPVFKLPSLPLSTKQRGHLFLGAFVGLCLIQGCVILALSPVGRVLSERIHLDLRPLANSAPFLVIRHFSGLTPHGVFMDAHFKGYNHVLKIEASNPPGQHRILPMTKPNGQPGYIGRVWVNWNFRTLSAEIDDDQLKRGFAHHTAFWLKKYKLDPETTTLTIYSKTTDVPFKWEKDLLSNAIKSEWKKAGTASWSGDNFRLNMLPIESIQSTE